MWQGRGKERLNDKERMQNRMRFLLNCKELAKKILK